MTAEFWQTGRSHCDICRRWWRRGG